MNVIVSFIPLDCGLSPCTAGDLAPSVLALTIFVVAVLFVLAMTIR